MTKIKEKHVKHTIKNGKIILSGKKISERNYLHAHIIHNSSGSGAHKNKKRYDRKHSNNPKNW